jgi:sporulation protein YlmC with PRC-barrel domain
MIMAKIFAKHLSDRKVVTTDGSAIGTLYNITVDLKTGRLIDLVVKPDPGANLEGYNIEDNFVLLPFECVRAVQDFIAIDKKAAVIQ